MVSCIWCDFFKYMYIHGVEVDGDGEARTKGPILIERFFLKRPILINN